MAHDGLESTSLPGDFTGTWVKHFRRFHHSFCVIKAKSVTQSIIFGDKSRPTRDNISPSFIASNVRRTRFSQRQDSHTIHYAKQGRRFMCTPYWKTQMLHTYSRFTYREDHSPASIKFYRLIHTTLGEKKTFINVWISSNFIPFRLLCKVLSKYNN